MPASVRRWAIVSFGDFVGNVTTASQSLYHVGKIPGAEYADLVVGALTCWNSSAHAGRLSLVQHGGCSISFEMRRADAVYKFAVHILNGYSQEL